MPWPFTDIDEPDYDSGFVAVPSSLGVLTALTVRLMGLNVTNTAIVERTLTLTNTAGEAVHSVIVQPGQSAPPVEWAFMEVIGLKWVASGAGVTAKLWGYST